VDGFYGPLCSSAAAMKPKMTNFLSCDHLVNAVFLSRITLIEVTIRPNQWRDDTLSCFLYVNWKTSFNNNDSPVYSTGGGRRIVQSEGANQQGGERARGEPAKGRKKPDTQRRVR